MMAWPADRAADAGRVSINRARTGQRESPATPPMSSAGASRGAPGGAKSIAGTSPARLRAFDEKVESMMVDSQDGANQIQGPHWDREASHEWGSLIPTICANVSLRQSNPLIPARKLPSCTTWL